MATEHSDTPPTLAAMRAEIDRIDEALHELLIERGEIIDALIAIKRTEATGSAFRPRREADMLRRLLSRHHGILPLDTVESIWRVIISTFTYVQAPYSVHISNDTECAVNRDVARFHFGFTVPLVVHDTAAAVIAALASAAGDLGLLHAGTHNATPWWQGLAGRDAPKIIARLPFVDRPDHPAGRPHYVIAGSVCDAAATDITLYAATAGAVPDADRLADLRRAGISLIDHQPCGDVVSLLLAAAAPNGNALREPLHACFPTLSRLDPIGSHAAIFSIDDNTAKAAP